MSSSERFLLPIDILRRRAAALMDLVVHIYMTQFQMRRAHNERVDY